MNTVFLTPAQPLRMGDADVRLRSFPFALRLMPLLVALVFVPLTAQAQHEAQATQTAAHSFAITAGPLSDTLASFARQVGISLVYSAAQLEGVQSAGLHGQYGVTQGLSALLSGTGNRAVQVPGGIRIEADVAQSARLLEPVVVTASTTNALPPEYAGGQVAVGGRVGVFGNRDVMDTPFSMTSYTSELIDNQQARSVLDVLSNDPSVVMGWPRDSYVDQFNVRGFNTLGEDFTYDGLYGILPAGKAPVEVAERVEVVRGMSALLRGISPAGSIGAAINLVPKRATTTPITRFTTSYDSTAHVGGHLDVGRRFGENDEFGIRTNLIYRDGDTLRRDSSKQAGTGAVGLDYRGDALRISTDFGYDYLEVKRGEYWYFLNANDFSIPSPPDNRQNNTQPWNRVRSKTGYAMTRAEVDINSAISTYIAVGGQRSDLRAHLPEPIIENSQGDLTEYFAERHVEKRAWTGEAGVTGQFFTGDVEHKVTLGGTLLSEKVNQARVFAGDISSNLYNPVFVPEPNFLPTPEIADRFNNPPVSSRSRFNSVALADEISMFDKRLQIVGGIRRQTVDVSNYSALGRLASTYDKSAWTGGGGIVVKPIDNLSLYANYMEALNKGPVAPINATNAGEIFSPYKSKQYEVGAKYDFGSVMATVGLFQVSRPSGITNPQTLVYSLDGEQRNRGIELGLTGEITPSVRVIGGAMLLDAELNKTQSGTFDGNRAPGAPKYNVRLGFEWDTPFVHGLTLTSRVNHSSSQYVDNANQQTIPAWTTADLGGRYTHKLSGGQTLTVRAEVRNVFDKTYWASSIGGWLNAGSGRSLTLSTTLDF